MRFRRLRRYAPNSRELRVNRRADCYLFGQKRKDKLSKERKGAFFLFLEGLIFYARRIILLKEIQVDTDLKIILLAHQIIM